MAERKKPHVFSEDEKLYVEDRDGTVTHLPAMVQIKVEEDVEAGTIRVSLVYEGKKKPKIKAPF